MIFSVAMDFFFLKRERAVFFAYQFSLALLNYNPVHARH